MKILYLAAGYANLDTKHNVVYNDLYIPRDINCDMLDVELSSYDLIIATPPCNFWSRANSRFRYISPYSLNTKHLLPSIIKKLEKLDIPIIIENVINKKLMFQNFDTTLHYYEIGRHCYFTNRYLSFLNVPQKRPKIKFMSTKQRQGTDTAVVFQEFIKQELGE